VLSEPVAGAQFLIFSGMVAFRGRAGISARIACRAFPGDDLTLGCEEDGELKKPAVGFGLHLTLDGYGCSYERLTNLDAIYKFLDTCPDVIHMTKIMPPYVFKYHGKVPEDWGVSGFVLIAESHISIHTFPERGYLSVDIFSCKDFDYQKAVAYVSDFFGIARHEINVLDRGLEFPREVRTVEHLLRQERDQMRG
jgi:S-adenosylmethionine decarboxylase